MSVTNLVSRLLTTNLPHFASSLTRNVSASAVLSFKSTPCLFAEPLKRKKRIDPAVLKAREERKKKKIEKQIRRLEKNAKQFKAIEEIEVPLGLLDEIKIRRRPRVGHSAELLENRALLEKQWALYKLNQHENDVQNLACILSSQEKALNELRKVSEDLYQKAIQINTGLIPFKSEGPVETPKIENYDSPDGDYTDVSRKWE